MSIRRCFYLVSYTAPLCIMLIVGAVISSLSSSCRPSKAKHFPNVKVQFVNQNSGWIIGPRLLQTKDGGQTWEVIRESGNGTVISQVLYIERQLVQYINPEIGYVMGSDGLLRTTDGGRSWSGPFPISPGQPNTRSLSIFFISEKDGWTIGEDVYHTSDSGQSWQRLSKSPINDLQPTFWFVDEEHGIMTSMNGKVYLTDDGGRNWKIVWETDKTIYNIFFIDKQNGWVVGEKGLVALTTDGGRKWTIEHTSTTAFLTSIFFIDKRTGWAAGFDGTILLTKDGGTTWKQAAISGLDNPPAPLTSISFANNTTGWAVGGNGNEGASSEPSNIVLTTDDGGQTWHAIQP